MTTVMTELPTWAAVVVALLVVIGSLLTLLGSIGLLRLPSFYDRMHAPTMGSSAGVVCISLASVICFSVLQSRLAVYEALIAFFVTVTTPVTFTMLARAAIFRDRVEGHSPLSVELEDALAAAPQEAKMEDERGVREVEGGDASS